MKKVFFCLLLLLFSFLSCACTGEESSSSLQHEHIFASEWISDGDAAHYRVCTVKGCDARDTAAHGLMQTGEFTADGVGFVETATCADCGYTAAVDAESDLRLIFASDLHYNVPLGSASANNVDGLYADDRMQHFVDSILTEHDNTPIDGVFILGDLTSSEFAYRLFKEGHVKKSDDPVYDLDYNGEVNMDDYFGSAYDAIYQLDEYYFSQLREAGIPVYCIPGNHDTYDNEYWDMLFEYTGFGYTETEYIVKFEDAKTAIIMLNTYDEQKGSQTGSRTGDGKNYLAGTQQTLSYTPVDRELLFSFLDELTDEGFESVYIAGHYLNGSDPALVAAAQTYPIIKSFIFGDVHNDNVSKIGGVPSFVDGHYSQTLMEYKGELGERIFDMERLPLSYTVLSQYGPYATVDFVKEEMLYLGHDNYDMLSEYFVLTEVTKEESDLILSRKENVREENGKHYADVRLGYYSLSIREDLSEDMREDAEHMLDLIEYYSISVFLTEKGNTGEIPAGYEVLSEIRYKDQNGSFRLEGSARGLCFNYISSCPLYESFYKPRTVYKSYRIMGGAMTLTFVIEDEVTWTKDKK